jgi:hypothetical protein
MSIAGHVSQQMLSHYSHVRIGAKRTALDALVAEDKTRRYDTGDDTSDEHPGAVTFQVTDKNGGDDGTRTRDLCRDRAAF